jgi:hypothetical protein
VDISFDLARKLATLLHCGRVFHQYQAAYRTLMQGEMHFSSYHETDTTGERKINKTLHGNFKLADRSSVVMHSCNQMYHQFDYTLRIYFLLKAVIKGIPFNRLTHMHSFHNAPNWTIWWLLFMSL